MYPPRKSLLSLALVVGLVGTPTLAPGPAVGHPGGVVHPAVVQLATDERGIRRRRRARGAKVRAILWRAVGRVHRVAVTTPAAGERLQKRRPPHESLARGPPRSSDL